MELYLLLEGLFLVGLYIIISYFLHCSLRNSDTLVYFNIFARWRALGGVLGVWCLPRERESTRY